MSELVASLLSHAEARSLTEEVKQDAHRLWRKLVELYDGEAWDALGYDSWRDYWIAEFGEQSLNLSYKQIAAGRVVSAIEAAPLYQGTKPTERQARELAPLLDRPEELRQAYAEVVELHPEPTAADVRAVVQRKMDVHYSSATDDWSTPQDFFGLLDNEFHFTLDVCATEASTKVPHHFFTEAEDGLAQDWAGEVCWMNPPYGDEIKRWVAKAWESAQYGATVVCLVPARVETNWWWDYCRAGEIRFLRGRLKFGGGDSGAPFPSAVVVFPREPRVVWWERP